MSLSKRLHAACFILTYTLAGLYGQHSAPAGFLPVDMPDVFDMRAGYKHGSEGPALCFVCYESDMWEKLVLACSEPRFAEKSSVYFFLLDPDSVEPAFLPDSYTPRKIKLVSALADMEVSAVFLLEAGQGEHSVLQTASLRGRSPLALVQCAENAFAACGLAHDERLAADFYAAAGFADGFPLLSDWHRNTIPAVALRLGDSAVLEDRLRALVSELVSNQPDGTSYDINYVRYPMLNSIVTVSDTDSVFFVLVLFSALALASGFGWLRGKHRVVSFATILSEEGIALGLAFVALVGARFLYHALSFFVKRFSPPSIEIPWAPMFIFIVRICTALSVYYAASGGIAKLSLYGKRNRTDAARAALFILCTNALALFALFPPAVPLTLVVALLSFFASNGVIAAMLSLIAACVFLLPFFDLRVFVSIAALPSEHGRVVSTLFTGFIGALVVAPLGLWLSAALSPKNRLIRPTKHIAFWLALSCAFALTEAVVRAVLIV